MMDTGEDTNFYDIYVTKLTEKEDIDPTKNEHNTQTVSLKATVA